MRGGMGVVGLITTIGALTLAPGALADPNDPPAPGPGLPQVSELPGASAVPNISQTPGGGPEVQGVTNGPQGDVTTPAVGGLFGPPFAEPGPNCPFETNGSPDQATRSDIACKPAGVSVVVLPGGRVLYWDGLEGEERIKYSIVGEYGETAGNDQSRLLNLSPADPSGSSWQRPQPPDGGADGSGDSEYLVPNAPDQLKSLLNDQGKGSGALFCADQVLLSNGEVLVPGGTDYYSEPHVPGTGLGVAELQGLRNTRVFDPRTSRWYASGPMHWGRWYPGLVTLPDGKVFVASGVTKLLKPVYTQRPLMSGTNVEQTETFDPASGRWSDNGDSATRSLPLYPRLHVLPDGHVYYDAGGQTFNPFGQSYDEALWNQAASYDPRTRRWQDLGIPLGASVDPSRPTDIAITAGFRGSAFSVMLPLIPPYTSASFLSAGGVLGVSPGAYVANTSSIVNTVTTDDGAEHFSSQATGPLHNARWFSSAVSLPTGQVIAFNGANRDDVVGPGTSFGVTQAELFDPQRGTWSPLADSRIPRTYHNSAVLLPSGQVLVGGNAPISTLYAYNTNLPGGFSNDFRDPSFQVYDPPYLHWGIPQPTISDVRGVGRESLAYGQGFDVVSPDADRVASVVLVRNTAFTHVVDNDQRTVVLPMSGVDGDAIHVKVPPSGNVAPPGPYLLFLNEKTDHGLIPSVARQVFVGPKGRSVPRARRVPGRVPSG
jgi:hypothetical protein